MNFAVIALHNVGADMFQPYDPATAELHHAHTFQIIADGPEQAAQVAFEVGNVDPDGAHPLYANQVREYRTRMNRSLSVGDVLVVEEADQIGMVRAVLACEPTGWKALPNIPDYVAGTNLTDISKSYEAHQAAFKQATRIQFFDN